MKIKGAFPVRWAPQDGAPGTGVTINQALSFTKYAASTSGTTHPADSSSDWKTAVPTVANGSYLWTWVHVHYSDGTYTNSYSVSRMGIDGKGISSSVTKYCQKANTNTAPENFPESDWGTFPTSLTNDYWLYSRTIVTYSDGDTATSYDVQQIGQGAYYAGCQEYYAVSNDGDNAPSGYPNTKPFTDGVAVYANGEAVQVSSPWSTSKPEPDNSAPYIWNFEISFDSRGNKYVTRPICIGNFAKGITSIVETYTISSHNNMTDMLNDTTERNANPWQDEAHAVAPTTDKPYQWNKTVTSYNKGADDTFYHISAMKGADGKGATYIDLDNENDSMLYDAEGNLIGGNNGWVSSNIYLYSNGQKITSNLPDFSILSRSSNISAANAVIDNTAKVLTIKGLTGDSGWVIIGCTYQNTDYTAKMTVKRLVGVDKYELQLDHNAVSYNVDSGTLDVATITVNVYRTAQNGTRTRVTTMATYGLTAKVYPNGSSTGATSISFNNSGVGSVSLDADFASNNSNFAIVLFKSNVEVDRETIPIAKVHNGSRGPGAIILDLDNENDSMLYDGAGVLKSGDVTSQAKLWDAGVNKTDVVTSWDLVNKINVSGSISNSGLVTITGITGTSGSAEAVATYGGQQYSAKITIKKLVGVDKYEVVCTPDALTYNTTKATNQQQAVNVKVYRTGQNGARTLVENLSDYGLTLRYYWQTGADTWGGPTTIADGTTDGKYHNGADRSLYASMYMAYRFEVLNSSSVILDVETVPISKTSDGEGKDAIMLDLDNENDSILYDGADNPVSDVVVSTGSLYKGPDKVTSGITWSIASVEGCTMMNSGAATSSSYSRSDYPTAAWISSNGLVKVNGLSASQGKVVVRATYNGKNYDATLTLKKLRGVDKYELVVSPAALSYNSTTNVINGGTSATVKVEIWRTAQNGARTIIDDFNGDNQYGLSISVTPDAGSLSGATQKSYGLDFAVSNTLANTASSIAIVLKKGTMTYDSETIPIAKTTNGSGSPGPAAKSIYRLSFEKPATPTGASPQGSGALAWHDDPYEQDVVKIDLQGDWYRDTDGYMRAPAIGTYQGLNETLSFVTTAANQKVYLRVKCTLGASSYIRIGNLDATNPATNYMRSVSGSNQDTGDIEVNVPNAGTHFIIIRYYRSGYTDTYAKFQCGIMDVWQSNAKTYNAAGTITEWSTPFKVGSDSEEDKVQTRANILKQTAFISNQMDAWDVKNGSTTNGTQGRNAYKGTADYGIPFKGLLRQVIWDPNGDQPLLPNTWYTLSFWAKSEPYIQKTIGQTSYSYGFGSFDCYLTAGVQCTMWINGYCSSAARSGNKELRVYIYGPDGSWSWSTSVAITSTGSTTNSITFTPPETGKYTISAYAYPSGATSSQTVTLNWVRIDRGMKMVTYIYPDCESNQQSSYTPIDTTAGRIKDGVRLSSSPTDNNAEFKLTEDWTKHVVVFKTRSYIPSVKQMFLVRMHQSCNGIYICMPKLEQGTQATDYVTNDNDPVDMAIDETGFPNDRGVWVESPSEAYQWNETRRDYVASSVSGDWKRYFVRKKGMVVPNGTGPTSGGNSYWEEGSRINTLLVNTMVATNAEITFAKSNRILVTNNDGTVAAGMGGAADGNNDYPLWVGATYANRANAPFKVTLAGKLYASGCVISGESEFEGTLKGVTGTFKQLQAINTAGVVKAAIGFNSLEGKLYFEGDMQHQGYDNENSRSYRFYTSDLWCRGNFGAYQRTTMIVYGSYAYVYTKGIGNSGLYISLDSATSSGGESYYKVPCYSPKYNVQGDTAGFPVDTLIFNISGSSEYRYQLILAETQRVLVINGNDDQNNVKIYQNGSKVGWNGGEIAFVVQLPSSKINPVPGSSILGRGLIIGAFRDNDW